MQAQTSWALAHKAPSIPSAPPTNFPPMKTWGTVRRCDISLKASCTSAPSSAGVPHLPDSQTLSLHTANRRNQWNCQHAWNMSSEPAPLTNLIKLYQLVVHSKLTKESLDLLMEARMSNVSIGQALSESSNGTRARWREMLPCLSAVWAVAFAVQHHFVLAILLAYLFDEVGRRRANHKALPRRPCDSSSSVSRPNNVAAAPAAAQGRAAPSQRMLGRKKRCESSLDAAFRCRARCTAPRAPAAITGVHSA